MKPSSEHPLFWRFDYLAKLYKNGSGDATVLGWPAYATFYLAPLFGRMLGLGLRRLKLQGYRRPLYYRPGTSDPEVVRQIFAVQEYACVGAEGDVRYILDLGANIGCTSFYLLHRYPNAKAVVVEPDPGNMALCKKNLAAFADRVTFVTAGVWSSTTPLVVERGAYRDGREWAFQVRPAGANERADFQGVTVEDLIAKAGFPRVDLLKMDIEAAEAEVFRAGCPEWLARVRTFVVELHDAECERLTHAAAGQFPHTTERSGELTVFRFKKED